MVGNRSERYRQLPERIAPEDMTALQAVEPVPAPELGRDPEEEFLRRNAG